MRGPLEVDEGCGRAGKLEIRAVHASLDGDNL